MTVLDAPGAAVPAAHRHALALLARERYGWGYFGPDEAAGFVALEVRGLVVEWDTDARGRRRYALTDRGLALVHDIHPGTPAALTTNYPVPA